MNKLFFETLCLLVECDRIIDILDIKNYVSDFNENAPLLYIFGDSDSTEHVFPPVKLFYLITHSDIDESDYVLIDAGKRLNLLAFWSTAEKCQVVGAPADTI